jgi:hypothetical protein
VNSIRNDGPEVQAGPQSDTPEPVSGSPRPPPAQGSLF